MNATRFTQLQQGHGLLRACGLAEYLEFVQLKLEQNGWEFPRLQEAADRLAAQQGLVDAAALAVRTEWAAAIGSSALQPPEVPALAALTRAIAAVAKSADMFGDASEGEAG